MNFKREERGWGCKCVMRGKPLWERARTWLWDKLRRAIAGRDNSAARFVDLMNIGKKVNGNGAFGPTMRAEAVRRRVN